MKETRREIDIDRLGIKEKKGDKLPTSKNTIKKYCKK